MNATRASFIAKYNEIQALNQLKYAPRVNTVIEDNVHDKISTHFPCTADHDDQTVETTKKGPTTLCANEFKTLEACSKTDCDSLNFLVKYICYIKDAFKVNNWLKGVNNYIDSAGTPTISEFFKKFSLPNTNEGLNTKHDSLNWSMYTNYDVLFHLYVQMFLIDPAASVVTQEYIDSINKLQVFNIDNETIISVINANFLWQSVLLYAYKYLTAAANPPSITSHDVIEHTINILRQIQFTSLSSKKVNDSSGLNWVFGFDPDSPLAANDIHNVPNLQYKQYIKIINNKIYHSFTDFFKLSLPGSLVFDNRLDYNNQEYDFTGIQGFVAKSINSIKQSPFVKSRNENGKYTKMGEGMNALFDAYFEKFASPGPTRIFNKFMEIKILCYQILKFSGDSCHLNLSHILQLAWSIFERSGQINFGFGGSNLYQLNTPTPNENQLDTIILTDERIVPLRCMIEGISFYVENFNKFAECSNLTCEYIHYISDPKKKLQSLISSYYEYLNETKIIDNLYTISNYNAYVRLKENMDKRVRFELTDYVTWGDISTFNTAQINAAIIDYSTDTVTSGSITLIGMSSYIKYLQHIQRLSIGETLWGDNYDIFVDYFGNIKNRNLQTQTIFNENVEILVELLQLVYGAKIITDSTIKSFFIEDKNYQITDPNFITHIDGNIYDAYERELSDKIRNQINLTDFNPAFESIFGYMYSDVNKYISDRGKIAGNPKIIEEKPFWFSLFPYNEETHSFSEDGIYDLKKIIKATTKLKQGRRSMDDTIDIFIDCITLLFRYRYIEGPDVPTRDENFNYLLTNDDYNKTLKTYSDIFIIKDEFEKKLITIVDCYNQINKLFINPKGDIFKIIDQYNKHMIASQGLSHIPVDAYDILFLNVPTSVPQHVELNKQKNISRKEYRNMCKQLSSLITDIKGMITFFVDIDSITGINDPAPIIAELDDFTNRYSNYSISNNLNKSMQPSHQADRNIIKQMVNLSDLALLKSKITQIYTNTFVQSITDKATELLDEFKRRRIEYIEIIDSVFESARNGRINADVTYTATGGSGAEEHSTISIGEETNSEDTHSEGTHYDLIINELTNIIMPYISNNSIKHKTSMDYIYNINGADPFKQIIEVYSSIKSLTDFDDYIIEVFDTKFPPVFNNYIIQKFDTTYHPQDFYFEEEAFNKIKRSINLMNVMSKNYDMPINITSLCCQINNSDINNTEGTSNKITHSDLIKFIYNIYKLSISNKTDERLTELWKRDIKNYNIENVNNIMESAFEIFVASKKERERQENNDPNRQENNDPNKVLPFIYDFNFIRKIVIVSLQKTLSLLSLDDNVIHIDDNDLYLIIIQIYNVFIKHEMHDDEISNIFSFFNRKLNNNPKYNAWINEGGEFQQNILIKIIQEEEEAAEDNPSARDAAEEARDAAEAARLERLSRVAEVKAALKARRAIDAAAPARAAARAAQAAEEAQAADE